MQAHPVHTRQRERRWLIVLSATLVAAACQASEVLTVLPGDALTAKSPAGLPAPTGVAATPLTTSQVRVSWTDASPNESGFQVYRSGTANGVFALVTTTGPNVSSWVDTGRSVSTPYCYKVRAFRGGTTSDFSTVSCATTLTPPPPPPNAPYSVYAEPVDSATIRLTWWDGSSNEDGFRIERSIANSTTWTVVGTVAANVVSFTRADVLAEQGVCYRVIAFNVSGESPPYGQNCAVPPAAPTNFTLNVTAPGEIELSWTDNSAAETAYEVWITYGSPCCYGCDAGMYEYMIASLPPNTTRYRTNLASSDCQTILVYLAVGGGMRVTGYLTVPLPQ